MILIHMILVFLILFEWTEVNLPSVDVIIEVMMASLVRANFDNCGTLGSSGMYYVVSPILNMPLKYEKSSGFGRTT